MTKYVCPPWPGSSRSRQFSTRFSTHIPHIFHLSPRDSQRSVICGVDLETAVLGRVLINIYISQMQIITQTSSLTNLPLEVLWMAFKDIPGIFQVCKLLREARHRYAASARPKGLFKDLSPLSSFNSLRTLNCSDGITDLSPLSSHLCLALSLIHI